MSILYSALVFCLHSALHFYNHILHTGPNLIHNILYASASHFLAHYITLDTFKSSIISVPDCSVVQGGKISWLLYTLRTEVVNIHTIIYMD